MGIQRCGQFTIPFYGNHLHRAGEQRACQAPLSRANLQYHVGACGLQGVHNPLQDPRVAEKMLAEPSQTLSRTSVRSSLAGAPPVKAAMSVNTASRMWRAGRLRRFTT